MIDIRRIARAVAAAIAVGAIALPVLAEAATETEVCLKAWDGAHYVVSEDDAYSVNANRPHCSAWETHRIVDLDDGALRHGDRVAVLTHLDLYWSAQPDGRLEANRGALGAWEVFVIEKIGGGDEVVRDGDALALRSEAFGRYVVAEHSGGSVVNADRGALGPWETFTVELGTATLRVTQPGESVGAIRGTGGIWSTCRPQCLVDLDVGTEVTLEASTLGNAGIEFDRWTGACAGQGPVCTFTLTGDAVVELHMRDTPTHARLTVRRRGEGRIADVVVEPVGDVWWQTTRQYHVGSVFTLVPHDDALHNATFVGWSGACDGVDAADDCIVTLDADTVVDVHYVQGPTHHLRVTQPGDVIGAVRGTDGIWSTCRPGCDRQLAPGTVVTLEANTVGNSSIEFDRWTGACAGQGPVCTFTLDADARVELHMRAR